MNFENTKEPQSGPGGPSDTTHHSELATEEKPPRFPPSRYLAVWGIMLLFASMVLISAGQSVAVDNLGQVGLFASQSDPTPFYVMAALAGLFGLICLLVGVWRLADKIDHLPSSTEIAEIMDAAKGPEGA
ncbi:MAG: hypothetical protein FWG16_01880 [Micrococcales bacterium]|nr:hypothetical protein [Micrococcales bacterium]